jgi:Holliday junction resolvase
MSGRRSRDKGARRERQLQRCLQDDGFAAEKVSGMYKAGPDLTMPLLGVDRHIELKSRDAGFKQIRDWLVDRYAVVVWVDRQEPIVCLRLRDAVEIARVAERAPR